MRTTDQTDRRGDAALKAEIQGTLDNARMILANTSALLELETDRLFLERADETEQDRLKTINVLIRETQKAMMMVVDIEAKLLLRRVSADDPGLIDLEAARREIESRLARLAA